ncbi:MAG: UBA/THIF-type binding protein [Bacteroidetes bacterium]|nr:UBA/THIF-type binding protein [Bacteroidota bacterium]
MISDSEFYCWLEAASLAPSADNMQPWAFKKRDDEIEVYYIKERSLPTDTLDMFGLISVGAAIQNIIITAENRGFSCKITYPNHATFDKLVALLCFSSCESNNELADCIPIRSTNRAPYDIRTKLSNTQIFLLQKSTASFPVSCQYIFDKPQFEEIALLDAQSSYIRLEYQPFHDELFDILRFSRSENEKYRYGLTFESLEVPDFAVFFAKFLKFRLFNDLVSKLGFGKLVAYSLSRKLTKSSCLCLISVTERDCKSYIEAGRGLEQLWLTCTKMGLSVQPYGVLPQYLTKLDIEPRFFTEKYKNKLFKHKEKFNAVFTESSTKFPALLLRIGQTDQISKRSSIRITTNNINLN